MMRPPATLRLLRALRRLIGRALWWFVQAHLDRPMSKTEYDRTAPDRAAGLQ